MADCICEHGCRNCGLALAAMGGCPAWDPCPVGRADDPACRYHHPEPVPVPAADAPEDTP